MLSQTNWNPGSGGDKDPDWPRYFFAVRKRNAYSYYARDRDIQTKCAIGNIESEYVEMLHTEMWYAFMLDDGGSTGQSST